MRIAFAGVSGSGKSTLARWLVSQEGPLAGLPICPVGSRSVAKEMGFVDPETGEGRPYDVDRADGAAYQAHLDIGWFTVDQAASMAMAGWRQGVPTVRSHFQQRLADAKIAWESDRDNQVTGFVTDRTSLDDCAYAILHCPEVATQAFIDRALLHTCETYDRIFLCPMDAGQWLDGDAARVQDLDYHCRYEVVLNGLLGGQHQHLKERIRVLDVPDLWARQEQIKGAVLAGRRDAAGMPF